MAMPVTREAEAYHYRGVELEAAGRLDEAEAAFRHVLALKPDAHGTARLLGVLLLSQGRLAEGFHFFEARHALPRLAKPALPFPEWRGEPLAGKRLLIWPEQGFGDQIQFARFAPILKAQGVDVTILCRPGLERLFAQSLEVRVKAAAGAVDFPDPDAWVMAGSLAARMGVTLEAVPAEAYLRSASPPSTPWAGLKVGVMSAGNPEHSNDANRSLPQADAKRLRSLAADIVELDPAVSGARDFADTADIIAGLDLVVSVDTAVAHLAGAMGKPCWVLIPAVSTDWRWLRERADSPWYPSMRLYRQATPGDWSPEIARITTDVAALRSGHGHG